MNVVSKTLTWPSLLLAWSELRSLSEKNCNLIAIMMMMMGSADEHGTGAGDDDEGFVFSLGGEVQIVWIVFFFFFMLSQNEECTR